MALNKYSEIDITASGDDFYDSVVKCKANCPDCSLNFDKIEPLLKKRGLE